MPSQSLYQHGGSLFTFPTAATALPDSLDTFVSPHTPRKQSFSKIRTPQSHRVMRRQTGRTPSVNPLHKGCSSCHEKDQRMSLLQCGLDIEKSKRENLALELKRIRMTPASAILAKQMTELRSEVWKWKQSYEHSNKSHEGAMASLSNMKATNEAQEKQIIALQEQIKTLQMPTEVSDLIEQVASGINPHGIVEIRGRRLSVSSTDDLPTNGDRIALQELAEEFKVFRKSAETDIERLEESLERKNRQAQAAELEIDELRELLNQGEIEKNASEQECLLFQEKYEEIKAELNVTKEERDHALNIVANMTKTNTGLKETVVSKNDMISELNKSIDILQTTLLEKNLPSVKLLESVHVKDMSHDLSTFTFLQNGSLSRILNLLHSSEDDLREKAYQIVRAYCKHRFTAGIDAKKEVLPSTLQLNSVAMGGRLIQRWMRCIETYEIDEERINQASQLIQESYDELSQAMLGLGINFQSSEPRSVNRIQQVLAGGCAELASLLPGDVIISVNGVDTTNQLRFREQLAKYNAGDVVEFGIRRSGKKMNVQIFIGLNGCTANEVKKKLRLASRLVYASDIPSDDSKEKKDKQNYDKQVYLCSTETNSNWAEDIAMPLLDTNNVTFDFRYQRVLKTTSEVLDLDTDNQKFKVILCILTQHSTGIQWMLVTELLGLCLPVVLVVLEPPEVPTSPRGEFSEEADELKEKTSLLRQLALRNGTPFFSTVEEGVMECIHLCKDRILMP